MKIYEMEQGSEEWFAIKYGKIGGSSLAEIMTKINKPVNNTAKYLDILSAHIEPFELDEEYISSDMERGNSLEPIARMEFERVYSKKVRQVGWVEMDNGIAGISPDGLIEEEEALETKCPARKKHMLYILNPIELLNDYLWQAVQYFVVLEKLKKLYLVSYRPENVIRPMVVVEVTKETIANKLQISDHVVSANSRINELKESIDMDIKMLNEF